MNYRMYLLCSAILINACMQAHDDHAKVFTISQLGKNRRLPPQQKTKQKSRMWRMKKKSSIERADTSWRQPMTSIPEMPLVKSATKKLLAESAQKIGLNFLACTVSDTITFGVTPQNQNGWVGPEQYIMMSYGTIRSFNKFTGQPDGVLNIDADSFFGVSANDVRISYSRFADRWFMASESSDLATGVVTQLLIAWSDSGIITTDTIWKIHTFTNSEIAPQIPPADVPADLDYEQLATDAHAVYLSVDVIDVVLDEYVGTTTVVMPLDSFIEGKPFKATIIPGILGLTYPPALQSEFVPPADNFDPKPQFGYLLNTPFDLYPVGTLFTFFRIVDPGTHAKLGPFITLTVPEYATGDGANNPLGNAPHKDNLYGSKGFLQNGIDGGVVAPHVRDKQLYACHTTQLDSSGNGDPNGDRMGVRWYQFDLTGDPTGQGKGVETETTVPALVQFGTLFDSSANPKFYYVPSIMTNKHHDLIIEGTVSGQNHFTNVFYASRKATDPLGTLREPVLVTHNTANPYNYGPLVNPGNINIGQRWGDLTSLCPDPSNDEDIWSTGQWAAIKNGWGIQATQLKPKQ